VSWSPFEYSFQTKQIESLIFYHLLCHPSRHPYFNDESDVHPFFFLLLTFQFAAASILSGDEEKPRRRREF
jgi:hypothetical protein